MWIPKPELTANVKKANKTCHPELVSGSTYAIDSRSQNKFRACPQLDRGMTEFGILVVEGEAAIAESLFASTQPGGLKE